MAMLDGGRSPSTEVDPGSAEANAQQQSALSLSVAVLFCVLAHRAVGRLRRIFCA